MNYLNMRKFLSLALTGVVVAACTISLVSSDGIASEPEAEPTSEVVLTSEVKWEPLNPARGDKTEELTYPPFLSSPGVIFTPINSSRKIVDNACIHTYARVQYPHEK